MSDSAKIIGSRYVLAVKDAAASAAYYEQQLGFSPSFAGAGWRFLQREKFVVMLGECADAPSALETGDHAYYAYIDTENIDALYEEYRTRQVAILHDIADKPWGQREFAIRTIDGHRITFGEAVNKNR